MEANIFNNSTKRQLIDIETRNKRKEFEDQNKQEVGSIKLREMPQYIYRLIGNISNIFYSSSSSTCDNKKRKLETENKHQNSHVIPECISENHF